LYSLIKYQTRDALNPGQLLENKEALQKEERELEESFRRISAESQRVENDLAGLRRTRNTIDQRIDSIKVLRAKAIVAGNIPDADTELPSLEMDKTSLAAMIKDKETEIAGFAAEQNRIELKRQELQMELTRLARREEAEKAYQKQVQAVHLWNESQRDLLALREHAREGFIPDRLVKLHEPSFNEIELPLHAPAMYRSIENPHGLRCINPPPMTGTIEDRNAQIQRLD